MPIRAPWTWMGETPHLGQPRLAPGRMEPDSPNPPRRRGGLSQSAVPCGKATATCDGLVPVLLGDAEQPDGQPVGEQVLRRLEAPLETAFPRRDRDASPAMFSETWAVHVHRAPDA